MATSPVSRKSSREAAIDGPDILPPGVQPDPLSTPETVVKFQPEDQAVSGLSQRNQMASPTEATSQPGHPARQLSDISKSDRLEGSDTQAVASELVEKTPVPANGRRTQQLQSLDSVAMMPTAGLPEANQVQSEAANPAAPASPTQTISSPSETVAGVTGGNPGAVPELASVPGIPDLALPAVGEANQDAPPALNKKKGLLNRVRKLILRRVLLEIILGRELGDAAYGLLNGKDAAATATSVRTSVAGGLDGCVEMYASRDSPVWTAFDGSSSSSFRWRRRRRRHGRRLQQRSESAWLRQQRKLEETKLSRWARETTSLSSLSVEIGA